MTAPVFAYLVPEFPGQTHVFFQREIEALRAHGAPVDVLSTTPPTTAGTGHPWAAAAQSATTYLGKPTAGLAAAAVAVLLRAAVAGRLRASLLPTRGLRRSERLRTLAAAAILAARARHAGWTHVHVHSCGRSALVARTARELRGVSYSLTLHGPLADYGPLQREKWENAAFGLVITEGLRDDLARVVGADVAARTRRAPMGIRVADTVRPSAYVPWRGDGPAQLFSCGRLNPSKGHDTLVRAVAALAAEGVPVTLTIAGEDEQGGRGYRRELEALVTELGLDDRITLLGAVGEDTVRHHLLQAHVFVLASRGEPLGVAIMEAMGLGLPVVVGDGGGVRELVDDRVGRLVTPGDPVALAAATAAILRDPEGAVRAGERGRARVRAEFTSEGGATTLLAGVRGAVSHAASARVPVLGGGRP